MKTVIKTVFPSDFRSRIKYLIQKNNLNPIIIKSDEVENLKGAFDEDIDKLQDILNKDLSIWKR